MLQVLTGLFVIHTSTALEKAVFSERGEGGILCTATSYLHMING